MRVFADAFVASSEASLVTTADRVKPLVEGELQETVSLPPDRGLLVALAGEPTRILHRSRSGDRVRAQGGLEVLLPRRRAHPFRGA